MGGKVYILARDVNTEKKFDIKAKTNFAWKRPIFECNLTRAVDTFWNLSRGFQGFQESTGPEGSRPPLWSSEGSMGPYGTLSDPARLFLFNVFTLFWQCRWLVRDPSTQLLFSHKINKLWQLLVKIEWNHATTLQCLELPKSRGGSPLNCKEYFQGSSNIQLYIKELQLNLNIQQ